MIARSSSDMARSSVHHSMLHLRCWNITTQVATPIFGPLGASSIRCLWVIRLFRETILIRSSRKFWKENYTSLMILTHTQSTWLTNFWITSQRTVWAWNPIIHLRAMTKLGAIHFSQMWTSVGLNRAPFACNASIYSPRTPTRMSHRRTRGMTLARNAVLTTMS